MVFIGGIIKEVNFIYFTLTPSFSHFFNNVSHIFKNLMILLIYKVDKNYRQTKFTR